MQATLIDAIRWWARQRRDEPALIAGEERISYGELDRWADAVAAWLRSNGVARGDRIAVAAHNSLPWCALAHGAMRAGAILAPLSARATAGEVARLVARYQPRFCFHDEACRRTVLEGAGAVAMPLDELASLPRLPRVEPLPPMAPDDGVVIISTSGSTGEPKGVLYSHRSMLATCMDFAFAEPAAAARPRTPVFGPLSTSAGYSLAMRVLTLGGTVWLAPAFDPEAALRCIEQERITLIKGVPIFYERMAASPAFARADLSSIRLAAVGGAPVSRAMLEIWAGKGVLLRQMYGLTEAGGFATISSAGDAVSMPEQAGRGLPFTRLRTVDPGGESCPPGVPGQIAVRGGGRMVGYWGDPEATARVTPGGWLLTGDLGVIDEQGRLTMLDRIKDVIISGGLKVSAAEVERTLARHPAVREVAVIAARDERFGETPLAVVQRGAPLAVEELVALCRAQLSDYKRPRYLLIQDEPLPRLATGKIDKPLLRARYADAHLTLPRVC